MSHTQGPWHMGAGNGEGHIFKDGEGRMRLESGGTTLYPICKVVSGWDEQEDSANAKLIAAAPELLKACKSVLESIERNLTDDCLPETREVLRTVIAKAQGKAGA